MKRFFAFLIAALMLAGMLAGCGMDAEDGIVDTSPRHTTDIYASPSTIPQVSPTIIPDSNSSKNNNSSTNGSTPETKSPQVGESGSTKTSPSVDNKNT